MEAVLINWACGCVGGFLLSWLYCRTYLQDLKQFQSQIDLMWNEVETLGHVVETGLDEGQRLKAARAVMRAEDGDDVAAIEADLAEIAADMKGVEHVASDKQETADLAW